jgi:hypothetical protein
MWPIIGIAGLIGWLLYRHSQAIPIQQTVSTVSTVPQSSSPHISPKPDTSNSGVVNSVPSDPKLAGVPIDISYLSWYHPSDSLIPSDIASARKMTIRQIQTAYNTLGAGLSVNGIWDLPTQQATWDFQYLHTNDNPDNPLNVTAEFDQLTQNALQALYGTKTNIQTGFY